MESGLNKDKPVVRLRAFRAIDDPAACELFVQGHAHVLTSIGVTKVTSSKNEWTQNPAAFVLIVESLDKTKVLEVPGYMLPAGRSHYRLNKRPARWIDPFSTWYGSLHRKEPGRSVVSGIRGRSRAMASAVSF